MSLRFTGLVDAANPRGICPSVLVPDSFWVRRLRVIGPRRTSLSGPYTTDLGVVPQS